MPIANCSHCGRVFQKVHSSMCPPCLQESSSKVSAVYRYVQENPNLTLESVAEACGFPFKEVEQMLFDGRLGTAAAHLIAHCQMCNTPMLATRGHFCHLCADKVETQAGLDRPRPEETEVIPERRIPPPSSSTESARRGSSYGFKRVSSE